MTGDVRSGSALLVVGFCLAILVLSGCSSESRSEPDPPPPPEVSIDPQPIPINVAIRPARERLPRSARAHFPSFDGDSFFVSIPPSLAGSQKGADVFAQVVGPVLRAVGFERELEELGIPPGEGARLPPANLAQLATVVCFEVDDPRYQRYQPVCDTMRSGRESKIAERVFQNGDGMSSAQFKADLERQRYEYFFPQRVGNVPIEHAGVLAGRWEGETVTVVHGSVFNRYVVTNEQALDAQGAIAIALDRLAAMKGVLSVKDRRRPPPAELVLLPYGEARTPDGATVAGLKYAWRTLLFGTVPEPGTQKPMPASWLAWIDAKTGALLALEPEYHEVNAQALSWRRDPSTPTQTRMLEVDAASGGQYILEFNDSAPGRYNRIDRLANGTFADGEVSIPDSGVSSATFAQFNQAPINDAANAVCPIGGNNTFRQANALAHLDSYRRLVVNAGSFPLFPQAAVTVWMDSPGSDSNSAGYDFFGSGLSLLRFTEGSGFVHANCPNQPDTKMNGAQDATTMTHEFAHLSTPRLHDRRPGNWCGMATCPMPTGAGKFHDFADAWAQGYASTPCMSGYSNKNVGGANASLNCIAGHSEEGQLPRLAHVTVPFDPANPNDHFPEHRNFAEGDYPDGQIAAAALWQVRQGMRSKCLPSGTAQFWVRLNRALWNFGFEPGTICVGCDFELLRKLQDLQRQLLEQWATAGQPGGPPAFHHNGAHTSNKVMSGFAKTGIFLVPKECIDGDAASEDVGFCPAASGGENGGDAVVDVDDNEPADDTNIDGIVHREVDYSLRAGGPPTFHVWTGPSYKFQLGSARIFVPSATTPSICNSKFQVEAASDDAFTTNLTTSGWTNVPTTSVPGCYGTWTPSTSEWDVLKGTAGDVKIYYRVRTRNAADTNEKISTSPGNGLFTVPPAYIIANDSGTP